MKRMEEHIEDIYVIIHMNIKASFVFNNVKICLYKYLESYLHTVIEPCDIPHQSIFSNINIQKKDYPSNN